MVSTNVAVNLRCSPKLGQRQLIYIGHNKLLYGAYVGYYWQLPAGLLLQMSAYVIILWSHPLDVWYIYLYSSFHFRTISLVERALVGGHCVRRLIRGHRVCPAGRLIRSLTDEGRGFDSHIVHT